MMLCKTRTGEQLSMALQNIYIGYNSIKIKIYLETRCEETKTRTIGLQKETVDQNSMKLRHQLSV